MNRRYTILMMTGFLLILAGCESDDSDSPQPNVYRTQLSEKDFIKGQYFWLTASDSSGQPGDPPRYRRPVPNCRENYRLFSHRNHYALPPDLQIQRAEFWINPADVDSGTPGRPAVLQDIRRWALSWEDFWIWGEESDGFWQKLRPDTDYTLDTYLGVIRLRQPMFDGNALACAFATANDTIGTFAETTDTLSLVLLKSPYYDPDYINWNLMFRHVYPLSMEIADLSRLKLTISHCAGGADEMCPPGMSISYLTYFYFDLEQPDGLPGPDGMVDNYSTLLSRTYGELHFLDLTPFDPSGFEDPPGTPHLWDFTLLEQTSGDVEGFRAPYLYTEPAYQLSEHAAKWQIFAEYQ